MGRIYGHLTQRAFTLVELLVVVAIVAVLSAILFPAFSMARERGRRAACMSNLKQIGAGWLQYLQDYDGTSPINWRRGNTRMTFISRLDPYLKSRLVWRCPSDSERPASPGFPDVAGLSPSYGYNTGPWTADTFLSGYDPGGLLSLAIDEGFPDYTYLGRHQSAIESPSQMFLCMDSSGMFLSLSAPAVLTTPPATRQSAQRHGMWSNTLFTDGHVKPIALRFGNGMLSTSYPSIPYIAIPREKAYYNSWCASPELQIYADGPRKCAEALPYIETHITSWLPE